MSPPPIAPASAPPEPPAKPEPVGAEPVGADAALRARAIVLVGLMGVGKTTVGRGLAQALGMAFRDADEEVERAANRSVADIFAEMGEAGFRDGERRVIARLLTAEPPHVLAFGGGAFLDPRTRALARERALAVWLKVDLDVLARRVARRSHRPLLYGKSPQAVLAAQAEARYPAYAEAHLSVELGEVPKGDAVGAVLAALRAHVAAQAVRASRRGA